MDNLPQHSGTEGRPSTLIPKMLHIVHCRNKYRPQDNNIKWWQTYCQEFFADYCIFRMSVKESPLGHATYIPPGLQTTEVPYEVLPRMFQFRYEAGMQEERLYPGTVMETPLPGGCTSLICFQAAEQLLFEGYSLVQYGHLKVVFNAALKIQVMDFNVTGYDLSLDHAKVHSGLRALMTSLEERHTQLSGMLERQGQQGSQLQGDDARNGSQGGGKQVIGVKREREPSDGGGTGPSTTRRNTGGTAGAEGGGAEVEESGGEEGGPLPKLAAPSGSGAGNMEEEGQAAAAARDTNTDASDAAAAVAAGAQAQGAGGASEADVGGGSAAVVVDDGAAVAGGASTRASPAGSTRSVQGVSTTGDRDGELALFKDAMGRTLDEFKAFSGMLEQYLSSEWSFLQKMVHFMQMADVMSSLHELFHECAQHRASPLQALQAYGRMCARLPPHLQAAPREESAGGTAAGSGAIVGTGNGGLIGWGRPQQLARMSSYNRGASGVGEGIGEGGQVGAQSGAAAAQGAGAGGQNGMGAGEEVTSAEQRVPGSAGAGLTSSASLQQQQVLQQLQQHNQATVVAQQQQQQQLIRLQQQQAMQQQQAAQQAQAHTHAVQQQQAAQLAQAQAQALQHSQVQGAQQVQGAGRQGNGSSMGGDGGMVGWGMSASGRSVSNFDQQIQQIQAQLQQQAQQAQGQRQP